MHLSWFIVCAELNSFGSTMAKQERELDTVNRQFKEKHLTLLTHFWLGMHRYKQYQCLIKQLGHRPNVADPYLIQVCVPVALFITANVHKATANTSPACFSGSQAVVKLVLSSVVC